MHLKASTGVTTSPFEFKNGGGGVEMRLWIVKWTFNMTTIQNPNRCDLKHNLHYTVVLQQYFKYILHQLNLR